MDLMLNVDLSQIEFRIAAAVSGDATMIKEVQDGVDVHTDNAIKIFGADPGSPGFSEVRTTAKIVTFRLLYGGTAYGFYMDQKMPNYSLEKWEDIVNKIHAKYPGLASWQKENIKFMKKNGYLRTPSGRFLGFALKDNKDGSKSYSKRDACNYPVQSMSADTMYIAMCVFYDKLKEYGCKSKIVLQVHDSMVLDCKKEEVPLLSHIAVEVFEDLPKYLEEYFGWSITVPLTGDCEFGESYGAVRTFDARALDKSNPMGYNGFTIKGRDHNQQPIQVSISKEEAPDPAALLTCETFVEFEKKNKLKEIILY